MALTPRCEVEENARLYFLLDELNADTKQAIQFIWRAFSYGVRNQDPVAMSSAQLDDSQTENSPDYSKRNTRRCT
jgi:hypothetical protein